MIQTNLPLWKVILPTIFPCVSSVFVVGLPDPFFSTLSLDSNLAHKFCTWRIFCLEPKTFDIWFMDSADWHFFTQYCLCQLTRALFSQSKYHVATEGTQAKWLIRGFDSTEPGGVHMQFSWVAKFSWVGSLVPKPTNFYFFRQTAQGSFARGPGLIPSLAWRPTSCWSEHWQRDSTRCPSPPAGSVILAWYVSETCLSSKWEEHTTSSPMENSQIGFNFLFHFQFDTVVFFFRRSFCSAFFVGFIRNVA